MARGRGNAARDSEGGMARAVSTWLMVFAPCVLVYAGPAHTQYLPSPSAAESPAVSEPNLFDPNSIGTAPAEFFSPPSAAEAPSVIEQNSFNDNSIMAARAQYFPAPNVAQSPAFIPRQYVAVSSSGDADSLGNRSAYVDSTFAPFGIYESGVRFRLLGNASWYKFVTNEETGTLGSGRYLEGAFLVGYGVYVPGFNITWLLGPAFAENVSEGAVTDRWGARAALEMYAKPTDLTMASTSAAYSTVTNNLQVQAKLGLKIFGDVYFGPEAKFTWQKVFPFQVSFSSTSIATTTPVSPQEHVATTRVGGHLSAMSLGPVLFSISGGWAHDRQLGSGYYGSVSFYQPF
jgi:hypothetical protein